MEAFKSLGIDYSEKTEDLLCYSYDASRLKGAPSLILWPESTDDVTRILRLAYEKEIPVVPRGAGTSTTGSAVPLKAAVVVSFEKMDRILEIDKENLTATVEPGVINGRFQRELSYYGLFYPPDPASRDYCTIGGNVAVNAGGMRAVKYGVTGDYVLELEAVTADGRVIRTGRRTVKGVVGYDIKSLLVGSEGTLAVITKIILRLLPEPESVATIEAGFSSIEKAVQTVNRIIEERVIPRAVEIIDRAALEAVYGYLKKKQKPPEAMLIIELDGPEKAVDTDLERVGQVCSELALQIRVAKDSISREELWRLRRSIAPSLHKIEKVKINHDIVVPRSRMAEMFRYIQNLSLRHSVKIVSFGHAGDGNIHVNIMVPEEEDSLRKAKQAVKELFYETLRLGGTISGEHGIGISKAEYLPMEISNKEMDIMRGIKRLFDHKNILNPGKIFP